jgi:hypothetical protein
MFALTPFELLAVPIGPVLATIWLITRIGRAKK